MSQNCSYMFRNNRIIPIKLIRIEHNTASLFFIQDLWTELYNPSKIEGNDYNTIEIFCLAFGLCAIYLKEII